MFPFSCLVLGSEVQLKLRLSSNLSDVKLSVYSKDSIFACKKKLQVSLHVRSQRFVVKGSKSACQSIMNRNVYK